MKPGLITLSLFLLIAFTTNLQLAFSDEVEQVLDTSGKPIFPGGKYLILPAIRGPQGGGVRLSRAGSNSKCPVTVLQDYLEVVNGLPVKFSIPGVSTGEIFTGTPIEIEFLKKPTCVDSSKWIVFVDNDIGKACVGIGGPEDHPGKQTFSGTFSIHKYKFGYKLTFCITGSPTCLDIGRFDTKNDEGGNRLNLTEHEAFDLVFVDASSVADSGIRSVV